MSNPLPLEYVFPRIATHNKIQFAVGITYGKEAARAIDSLKGVPNAQPIDQRLADLVEETLQVNSEPVTVFRALDEAGMFEIRVMHFSYQFWVSWRRQSLGYFKTHYEAKAYVRKAFRPEINAFRKAATKLKKLHGIP